MSAKTSFLSEERKNVEQALALIEELLAKTVLSQYEVIALGTLLQNVYQGLEGILRYRLQDAGIKFQKTESWHKELLKKSLDHGFITQIQFKGFLELLLFVKTPFFRFRIFLHKTKLN